MNKEEIRWLTIMPLIGGMAIGAENSIGKPPKAIISYSDFTANDSQYVNYMNVTRNLNIPYLHIDNKDHAEQIKAIGEVDLVVGVPICSALSMLNTSKDPEQAGSGCQKNKYMKWIFNDAIDKFNAKVVMIENAPALATERGAGINAELKQIAFDKGYSYSIYETSTEYHGIPQARRRTFAIMWKSDCSPLMEYFKKSYLNVGEFLENNSSKINNELINENIITCDVFYNFLKEKYKDVRKLLNEANIQSCLVYATKHKLLNECKVYADKSCNKKWIHVIDKVIRKHALGLGTWDSSVKIHQKLQNAFISKNFTCVLHPTEERSLTVAEGMQIMGMPEDFELVGGKRNINMIAQNVPVCTATDVSTQLVKFLEEKLEYSNTKYIHQTNHNQSIKVGNDASEDINELWS